MHNTISSMGYEYISAVLDEQLLWENPGWLICENLYKGIFNVNEPNVMYVGMQHQLLSFVTFDVQAYLVRDYIIGKFKLPNRVDMDSDIINWMSSK